MRAYRLQGGWSLDHLQAVQLPDPLPGSDEVVIEMRAAALSRRDVVVIQRGYGRFSGELPLVPISQGCGRIAAIGDSVQCFSVGDRVCPAYNRLWRAGVFQPDHMWGRLGGPLDGVMREMMVVPADAVLRVPDYLSDEEAACLPLNGLTAWSALEAAGTLGEGDAVLVQGAGSVSLFALQIAKAKGAATVVVTGRPQLRAALQRLGADLVLDTTADPHWGRYAMEHTGGRGVDLVVDIGGASTLDQSLRCLAQGGHISLVGNVGGDRAELPLFRVFSKAARLSGIVHGSMEMFGRLTAFLEHKRLNPVVTRRSYGFHELVTALGTLADGDSFGNTCIRF